MELLANYSTPEQILSVYSQTLADLLQKASRGRFDIDKESQIQDFARNSFGIILASSSFSLIGKTLAAVILSEIGGDISKSSSVPKLVAYACLYPKTRRSGDSIHILTGIFLNVVLLTYDVSFGLLLLLPLLTTLPFISFTRENMLKVKTI